MSPEELWASKYAARFAEEKATEDARREQAFLDLPAVVCGEELRMMTPMDLLILNGISSPFVCADDDPTPGDIAVFLWWLNVENDHSESWRNERRKKRMLRRVAQLDFVATVRALYAHVAEIFYDAPSGGGSGSGESRRPLGTCFLVPLVMNVGKATHWSKAEILSTPLPQLFQFMKAIRAEAEGKEYIEAELSDRITAEFLNELHAQSAPREVATVNGAN